MRVLLQNRRYRRLFAAQCLALVGTGLATIALALLAYDVAGRSAGAVLGAALAIKMVLYVAVSPVAGALASRVPRRTMMVAADAVRVVVVLLLPWVGELWQVFALIAVLQAASATFTPVFQSVLPDVLPDEDDYTRALSASQLVVSVENVVGPLLAAAALLVVAPSALFGLTAIGFVLSAVLVACTPLPAGVAVGADAFRARLTRGVRILARTPRLRAVLALNAVVAATGVITLVTTVNVARDLLGGSESAVTVMLAAAGAGTASAAVVVPRLLERRGERAVMLGGAALAAVVVPGVVVLSLLPSWWAALGLWALLGAATGSVSVPIGRLVRAGAGADDRPAAFAAQFSLSHACWLVTYPLTGALSTVAGFTVAWSVLAVLVAGAALLARGLWPVGLDDVVRHTHTDSAARDHLAGAAPFGDTSANEPGRWVHTHRVVIDDQHPRWPEAVLAEAP